MPHSRWLRCGARQAWPESLHRSISCRPWSRRSVPLNCERERRYSSMRAVLPPEDEPVTTTRLFEPFRLRGVTLKNRILASPMCMYRADHDGKASDWHFAHYSRLAMGGAAMVMLEATAVDIMGRHCYADLGIWGDEHIVPLKRIADFMKSQQCVPALQLQHAGRKGGTRRPWHGKSPLNDEDIRLRGEPPGRWSAQAPCRRRRVCPCRRSWPPPTFRKSSISG